MRRLQQPAFAVVVGVDEPRGDDLPGNVNNLSGFGGCNLAQANNAVAGDADVGDSAGCACTVDNRAAEECDVEHEGAFPDAKSRGE